MMTEKFSKRRRILLLESICPKPLNASGEGRKEEKEDRPSCLMVCFAVESQASEPFTFLRSRNP